MSVHNYKVYTCDVIFRIVLSLFGALSFTATIYHWWFVETSADDVSDENKTKQQQQEQEMAEQVKKGDADVTNDDTSYKLPLLDDK